MKYLFLATVICGLCCISAVSSAQQSGTLKESLSFQSKILGKAVKYSIYLPPGYNSDSRLYPALYLLHGYTDDETGWTQFGQAHLIADRTINEGEASPMIIIMPDAGVSWYINDYKGKERYHDMFIQELIPYMEANYRIRSKKEFRAVAGLSMGGQGALVYAGLHPDMFTACVAMSSAVFTDDELSNMPVANYEPRFGQLFGEKLEGKDRISVHWQKYSPLYIFKNQPKQALNGVRWYIDCGDDDFLYKGNNALHTLLRDQGINHEYRVRDGGHVWDYWRTGLEAGLRFVSKSFHR